MKTQPLRTVLAAFLLAAASVADAATLYVDAASTNALPPYTNWLTAAAVIQDAVDAAQAGDTVLVTNGVYATGGRVWAEYPFLTNRVFVDPAVTLRSVNGPDVTAIQGYQVPGSPDGSGETAIRCAFLANGVIMSGFTLTNGGTYRWQQGACGGGAWCMSQSAVLTNCILTGNSAHESGGGAYGGTLIGCQLIENTAPHGGGAYLSLLSNCTLRGNAAVSGGGGADQSTLFNCVVISNTMVADGGGGTRRSILSNCVLIGNSTLHSGGGSYEDTLDNCTLVGNWAPNRGGGAGWSTLNNCTLKSNWVSRYGGGAENCILNNCTLIGNSAGDGGATIVGTLNNCTLLGNWATNSGGGSYYGTVNNCIIYSNTAPIGPNFVQDAYDYNALHYCCTTPLPTNGLGNTTNEPAFVDLAGGNLRLQSNSPCINAGNNAYATSSTDLDGRPRIVGASVDMGAYEFQGEFTNWLAQFAFPTDGSADFTDPDGDGFNNYQEYRCGTDPTNALSALRLLPPAPAGTNLTLTWPSATGRSYCLDYSPDLSATPRFLPLATNLPGGTGTTTFTLTNPAAAPLRFYRVGVE